MTRSTDRLAAVGVLALAGYAVVQFVRDATAPRPPRRVLSWEEALDRGTRPLGLVSPVSNQVDGARVIHLDRDGVRW